MYTEVSRAHFPIVKFLKLSFWKVTLFNVSIQYDSISVGVFLVLKLYNVYKIALKCQWLAITVSVIYREARNFVVSIKFFVDVDCQK